MGLVSGGSYNKVDGPITWGAYKRQFTVYYQLYKRKKTPNTFCVFNLYSNKDHSQVILLPQMNG